MTLEVTNASLRIDRTTLLHQIDFAVEPRQIVAVIGANGAGKTSLIRILSGDIAPSSGEVRIDGAILSTLPRQSRARRIAVLPQHAMLDFPFLGREVIAMGRIPHASGNLDNARIVDEIIERLQLAPLADRIYTTLSGGEKQRIQIARILCQVWDSGDASYLLFDEPTAPLDMAHQLGFLKLVQDIAHAGSGIMLVMHDINLAARFADRVAIMAGGEIIAQGAPGEVVNAGHLARAFDVDVDIVKTADGVPLVYSRARTGGAEG